MRIKNCRYPEAFKMMEAATQWCRSTPSNVEEIFFARNLLQVRSCMVPI